MESRNIPVPDPNRISPTKLPRINKFMHAFQANTDTRGQRGKDKHVRNLQIMNSPIERFILISGKYNINTLTIPSCQNNTSSLHLTSRNRMQMLSVIRTPTSKFKKYHLTLRSLLNPFTPHHQHSTIASLNTVGIFSNIRNPFNSLRLSSAPMRSNVLSSKRALTRDNKSSLTLKGYLRRSQMLYWPSSVAHPADETTSGGSRNL